MKLIILIVVIVLALIFIALVGCYSEGFYFSKRKDYLYYKKIRELLIREQEGKKTLLDVGGWKGEFINTLPSKYYPDKTVLDKSHQPKTTKQFKGIKADFIKFNPKSNVKYDMVICLQVLEHIPDEYIYPFTQKLFEVGRNVLISIPYKWKEGKTPGHLQDPVDEVKLYEWTERIPDESYFVVDRKKRLIAYYKEK